MRVLYDVSALLGKDLTSEGLYCKHLYKALRGFGVEVQAVYKVPSGVKENHIESHIGTTPKKFLGLFEKKGTVFHGPNGDLLTESDKFKKILSVNDLSMFRDGYYPPALHQQMQSHLKEQMQAQPDAVIVPTWEMHTEFLVRFPKYVNKVHVVTPGSDHIMDSSSTGDQKSSEAPYFLYKGTIDKRGNISGVLKAFHAYAELQKKTRLVIVGENGFGAEIIQKFIRNSPIADRISFLGPKPDSEMKKLYADAIATVIPSFYEGFSFPMVESMRMGTPVITSAFGSLKDVGGKAPHYLNPKDTEQIMGAMERVAIDRVYREKMIELGKEAVSGLAWLTTAKKIAEIYAQ